MVYLRRRVYNIMIFVLSLIVVWFVFSSVVLQPLSREYRVEVTSTTDGRAEILFTIHEVEITDKGREENWYRWLYDFSSAVLVFKSLFDEDVLSRNLTGIYKVNETVFVFEWDGLTNVSVEFEYVVGEPPRMRLRVDYPFEIINYSVRRV